MRLRSTAPIKPARQACRERSRAFALRDLLALIGVLGLLAVLHLPIRGNAKASGNGFVCLHNLRQLTLGWQLYAEDHQGRLSPNSLGDSPVGWVRGWLDFSGPDSTNVSFLLNPQYATLGPYTRTAEIYRCPEDQSTARIGTNTYPRVRSYSMSEAIGRRFSNWLPSTKYKVFNHISELTAPSPQRLFVFMDVHPDSINDGTFKVAMAERQNPGLTRIIDYPANHHNGGAALSFADGHVEFHRWTDPRTRPRVDYKLSLPLNIPSPNNPDMTWLSDRTSSLVR
jgi:prepilin-type processing-associated H-X9-DG protein